MSAKYSASTFLARALSSSNRFLSCDSRNASLLFMPMATHSCASSFSSAVSDEYDDTFLKESSNKPRSHKWQHKPNNNDSRRGGLYHRVFVLDCENGVVDIRSRREFDADQRNQPKQYRLLYGNIPKERKQVMVFIKVDKEQTPILSVDDKSGGRLLTQIRFDRLGTMDSISRWLGGPRDLYVQNETFLKGLW